MKYPNFNEEKKLWKKGFKFVVGLDEAGRGPLAGPVVAAAVCIENPKSQKRFGHWALGFGFSGIKDSKQLSPKKREELYEIIAAHPSIGWGVGIVSEKIIDKINILEATKLAMQKSLVNLENKSNNLARLNSYDRGNLTTLDFLLIDGNFKINSIVRQKSIIGGDEKVFSCAVASIIAKVTRDRVMQKFHKKYPNYDFNQHKGYPTRAHFASLKKFGPCKIHRKSFYPVKLSTA